MSDLATHQAVLSLQIQMNHMLAAHQTTNDLLAKILEFLQQPSGSDIRDLIVQILARFDGIEEVAKIQAHVLDTIMKEVRFITQRIS